MLAVLMLLLGFSLSLGMAAVPELFGWDRSFREILCYIMAGMLFICSWMVPGLWLFNKYLEK
jgi:hypothetical protein